MAEQDAPVASKHEADVAKATAKNQQPPPFGSFDVEYKEDGVLVREPAAPNPCATSAEMMNLLYTWLVGHGAKGLSFIYKGHYKKDFDNLTRYFHNALQEFAQLKKCGWMKTMFYRFQFKLTRYFTQGVGAFAGAIIGACVSFCLPTCVLVAFTVGGTVIGGLVTAVVDVAIGPRIAAVEVITTIDNREMELNVRRVFTPPAPPEVAAVAAGAAEPPEVAAVAAGALMLPEEPPEELICPITYTLFEDPVLVIGSGQTYERAAIEQHFQLAHTDPLTNVVLDANERVLVQNHAIRAQAEAWR